MISEDALMYQFFGTPPPSPPQHADSGESTHENDSDVEIFEDAEEESHGDNAFEAMLSRGPEVGMVFGSINDLFAAYKAFGKSKGFCVVNRNSRDDKYCMIACDRGRKTKVKKSTKRVDCKARINAINNGDGRWKISKVELGHNHELDPSMSLFMPGHRHMTTSMKIQLETNDMAGLSVCKNFRLLEAKAGGGENVTVNARDCRNFIDERRRLRLGDGDADAIRKLFLRLQKNDRSFFHLMDIDDRGQLRNVMWIHPRSRAAYEDFHDAVSFDTTYLVNRYNMPFATVVGVNHHNQSILLGCALLTHEHAESFKWFFSNWLEAMGGVYPTAILTDQCESIKIAIREVMPATVHRFCLWHILCKIPVKFKGVTPYTEAVNFFTTMVYNSISIAEFEDKWGEFVTQYNLEGNRWLNDLWNEREKWAPVYLRHIFWAGMRSTQRSESMHAFFDGYITATSTLKSFVEQYEIAISNKVKKEMEQDYKSKCVYKCPISNFSWERQLGKLYTNKIMDLFQAEIMKLWHCNVAVVEVPNNDALRGIERYNVLELNMISNYFHREYNFIVEYRPNGDYLSCECKYFEYRGILCCHILKVLVLKDIRLVNDRYILRRWRKDVYRPHSSICYAGGFPHLSKKYKMFQENERVYQECTDLAYQDPQRMKIINADLLQLKDKLSSLPPISINPRSGGEEDTDEFRVIDPDVVTRRGRPKTNRYKSGQELCANKRARTTNSRGGTTSQSRGSRGENASQSRRGGGRNSNSRGRGNAPNPNRQYVPRNNDDNIGSLLGTQGSYIF